MIPGRLLAKKIVRNSRAGIIEEELFLGPHLRRAEQAGEMLVTILGERILSQSGLGSDWCDVLRVVLPAACLLHDIGKANDSFQRMITGRFSPKERQPIRHELLSMLILLKSEALQAYCTDRMKDYINPELFQHSMNAILAGIGAHHLKLDPDLKKACHGYYNGDDIQIHVYTSDQELTSIFGEILPDFKLSFLSFENDGIHPMIQSFMKRNREWRRFLEKNSEWCRFASLIRPLVVCADVIASALSPEGIKYDKWLHHSLNNVASEEDLRTIVNERLNGSRARSFQVKISKSISDITLVEAGCGSGKTVGAYMWAVSTTVGKKLLFCYPTTGTATEGFRDYVSDSNLESALIHSRANVDMLEILETGEEEKSEVVERLRAVESYDPRIIICTVDTVLNMMVNGRNALMRIPTFANASFVFDEIHAYDARMFWAMIQFIEFFKNAKFLLMTASLQASRKALLSDRFPNLTVIESPRELTNLKRYKLHHRKYEKLDHERIIPLAEGKKALIVVNTVKAAQKLHHDCRLPSILYHSRYKYRDRIQRHREFIKRFGSDLAVIGISTQVAEMSLDIDSDILITEIAPIPSLIQRLGRLNRRLSPENPGPARDAFFFDVERTSPYKLDQLKMSEEWLERLDTGESISQADLSNVFSELDPQADILPFIRPMPFLRPDWFAWSESLRESGYTANVILESDVSLVETGREQISNLVIPMPIKDQDFPLFHNTFVVPDSMIHYTELEGASWN